MSTTETSFALSLAELSQIEEARIEAERTDRARRVADRARAEREEQERRVAEQQARERAEQQARAERGLEEAAARARAEARERAALDVARIEAEARARLAADNAARAHELAELRVRRETGRRRRELVLGAVLASVLAAAGFGAWDASSRLGRHERAAEELRERERSLLREREDGKRSELGGLERRHAALLARAHSEDAKTERATAEAARRALDPRSPTHDRLRAFAEALDALESRVDRSARLALLDRRRDDLATWATSVKRTKRLEAVTSAARAARSENAGAGALAAYERALDQLSLELGERTGGSSRAGGADPVEVKGSCQEGDPGCGLDGKPVF